MAIVKTDFYTQQLNQFAPHRLRGEYCDWGLNAQVMEVEIDESQVDPLYAGDKVTIVSTSTGKLKVKAAAAGDAGYGYILYNAKKEKLVAGDIVSVLRDGGAIYEVTDEAIAAGTVVYYDPADGGITATATGKPMGIALNSIATAVETGTLIVVEVVKEPLA